MSQNTIKRQVPLAIERKIEATPTSTGFSTLREYIISLNDLRYSIYVFACRNFSDMPEQNWGYTAIVTFEDNNKQVTLYAHQNNTFYVRSLTASSQWYSDWRVVLTNENIVKEGHQLIQTFTPDTNESYTSILARIGSYIKANIPVESIPSLKLIMGNYTSGGANMLRIGRFSPYNVNGYYSFTGVYYGNTLVEAVCRGNGTTSDTYYKELGYNTSTGTWSEARRDDEICTSPITLMI